MGWDEAGRATLCDFVRDVVDTPLKMKILDVFLCDPYLCLSSLYLAHRLGERQAEVQQSARELCAHGAFLYCESFAYSDLCSLSFQRHSEDIKRRLCLLRFALRVEPEFVWAQVEACCKPPITS